MKIRNLFMLLMWSTCTLSAAVYTPSTLPNPHALDISDYVCNPDGILSNEATQRINSICQRLHEELEVELVTIAIEQFDEETYSPFDFCQEVGNSWGIGSKERSTGIILFLATSSRDIRLHTGTGMEGVLPDAKCTDIRLAMSEYLANGDWDKGMVLGCEQIDEQLRGDDVKAELLLGYIPKEPYNTGWFSYLMLAFFALIVVAIGLYSSSNKEAVLISKTQYQSFRTQWQAISKVLMLVFPLPFIFFYLYFNKLCKSIRQQPVPCKKCGKQMQLISDRAKTTVLSAVQQTEERLGVNEFNVFECPSCGHKHVYKYPDKTVMKRYSECISCGGYTAVVTGKQVRQAATYSSKGKGVKLMECKHCGARWETEYSIPKKERPNNGFGVVGGIGSSGFRGGGFSGGGFSGGSFGGGSFSGGGSGGKF